MLVNRYRFLKSIGIAVLNSNTLYKAAARASFFVLAAAMYLLPSDVNAAAQLQNFVGASCATPSASYAVQFQIRSGSNQAAHYSIAFSADAVPAAGDSWVVGNCGSGTTVSQGGDATVWYTRNHSVAVPAGFSGGYLLIMARENWQTCSPPQVLLAIPLTNVCGTPTPTVTPTPFYTLVKSANVTTANVGDTITFCIDWDNPANNSITRTFYDMLEPEYTYIGSDSGCSASGQLVTCSFAAPAVSSGTKCIWVEVNSVP